MQACLSCDGSIASIELDGELDVVGAATLESLLGELDHAEKVQLDLGEVSFIDSAGIRALIVARRDDRVRLSNPSRVVRQTLEVAQITHLLDEG